MVGRAREKDILDHCVGSGRPEFVVVYGRRRVGKTYLIREFFGDRFSFYATGINNTNTRGQLKAFNKSLIEYGSDKKTIPEDWLEAFSRLKTVLENEKIRRDPVSKRRIVFLDEMPWMDTPRSDFKSALDYFWNSWGSAQKDLMLIVCGSATSWVMNNLLNEKGGFHNRITRRLHLAPFSLKECRDLLRQNNVVMTDKQIMETYLVFGGIPFYINLIDERLSLSQNIDALIFDEDGDLHFEYENLFRSLFTSPKKHYAIIKAMSERKDGITRKDLSKVPGIGDGEPLTKALRELVECGFVRKYQGCSSVKQGFIFQIVDPFILFSLKHQESGALRSWENYAGSPGYFAWRGNAFEILCLNHVKEIKNALGISGVETFEYAWRSKKTSPAVQIDLIIERRDGIINICEVKFTDNEFSIDADTADGMIRKLEAFRSEMHPDKALHLTLISAAGVRKNKYSSLIQRIITGEAFFD